MRTATSPCVAQELIELYIKKKKGLRKAAKALGVPHQKLMYNESKGQKRREFHEMLEKIRRELRIPKDEAWDMMLHDKEPTK